MALHYQTLTEVSRRASMGELTATEVVDAMLARIEALEPRLKAYVTVLADEARERAAVLDARMRAGTPLGILHAAPVALKDLIFTKGTVTTGGMAIYADWRPDEDATIVEAFSHHHPEVDPPVNPWDPDLWTGVSSSGPGVAVAAGLAHGAVGSDTLASIRFPSACCGLVGLKPTYGRVSRHGAFELAGSLDHLGPMTRSIDDAARMLQAIAGFDPKDPTSLVADVPDLLSAGLEDLRGVRIGIDRDYAETGVDPTTIATIADVVSLARSCGAEVVEVEVPARRDLVLRAVATCSVEAAIAHADTYPARKDRYGDALARLIDEGRDEVSAIEYAMLERQRRTFRAALETVLRTVDVILIPAMPVPPPTNAWTEIDPDDRTGASMLTFTAPFDYSGHPTITMPLDLDVDGRPRPFQLVGRLLGEKRLLDVARVLERAAGFVDHPPV
jgi:amidase